MEQSQIALNIMILDACRNNPFRNFIGFRSYGERGLIALAPPVCGSLIAYATQPDNVAADGTGRNGTYTKHLLRYLKQPGFSGIHVKRDSWVSVMYAEELNSGKSSVTLQRTDRHEILVRQVALKRK
jgi:hypothetical protein